MTAPKSSPTAAVFTLEGVVEGLPRVFRLAPGSCVVGSAGSSDLQLPVSGVSRRHARLLVETSRIVVIDSDSKNGTFVNGQRIVRAELCPGDELGFGTVKFLCRVLHPADRRFAITLSATSPRHQLSPADTPETMTETAWDDLLGRWLDLVGRFATGLRADLSKAVRDLAHRLPARSITYLTRARGGRWLVGAQHGILGVSVLEKIAGDPRSSACVELLGHEVTWYRRDADPEECLVIEGRFEGRARSRPFLRTLLGMVSPVEASGRAHRGTMAPDLRFPEGYVEGASAAVRSFHHQLRSAADDDLPVLLLGETGAGKELAARTLHLSSGRSESPFVAINCGAIPEDLMESELFGIGDRVATGVAPRRGKFVEADGGTLFLDEIAEMPTALQVKMLRALQDGWISPVGKPPVTVNVRVVAATNADLETEMTAGRFRRDLYYRVAGATVEVPALRDRIADLPIFVEAFLRTYTRATDTSIQGVTLRALDALTAYRWPGNVRELQHVIRRIAQPLQAGGVIGFDQLPDNIRASAQSRDHAVEDPEHPEAPEPHDRELRLDTLVQEAIEEAMARTGGNQVRAARLLGISRSALRRRLQRFGLL